MKILHKRLSMWHTDSKLRFDIHWSTEFLSTYNSFHKFVGQAEITYYNVPLIRLLSSNTDSCVCGIMVVCTKVPGSKLVTHYKDQVYRWCSRLNSDTSVCSSRSNHSLQIPRRWIMLLVENVDSNPSQTDNVVFGDSWTVFGINFLFLIFSKYECVGRYVLAKWRFRTNLDCTFLQFI